MRSPNLRPRLRVLAVSAACTVAATTLAACGSDGPGGSSDSLEVWVYQDGSTTIQEDFVERFNETSDIQVNLTQIPGENYQDRMRTAMGSPNAPDIFFNWGGGSIADFVEEDMLIDLTDTLADDPEFGDAFIPSILDAGAIDGRHYGVPMRGVQPVILFYNQTLFDEAGVEPPASLDDLFSLVDTFVERDITPAVLAGADPWTELMWLEYLLDRQGGAEIFDRIRNGDSAAWGDPAVLAAAQNATDLVEAGAFGNNFRSVSYTTDGASTFFAQGEAAMHLMGSWEFANQLSNQPEFAESDLAWATFPAIEGGTGDPAALVGNPTNYWSVNANVEGDKLDAAVEFLKLHASEDYASALIANGDIPTTADAESLLDEAPTPEYARFQYEMVRNAPSFTLSWDQALPADQSTPMIDNIEKLFSGQLSAEQFVEAMQNL
ncbi:extracellular solute-binding protein [Streptomyces sp. 3MP-14]|uniref:Extracellular solute-binding protein n=1 Tax=Streptomyces mimosae TaxID=2586635 RepID=A0A5N6AMF3_9ACTN|nr:MULTISPECIES: extracellular solute-binding protein [Streptomyces]KAB8169861.1 extracellular solute-binding protein [Streptomyces mimosae]KAB8178609.1 extracellular solute-binding protein [Streptomyces sp. 3MP-14]